jgi:hypothetical protein
MPVANFPGGCGELEEAEVAAEGEEMLWLEHPVRSPPSLSVVNCFLFYHWHRIAEKHYSSVVLKSRIGRAGSLWGKEVELRCEMIVHRRVGSAPLSLVPS